MTTNVSDLRLCYRPADAAPMIGIGKTTLFELIRSGAIKTVKIGRARLIPRQELERFVASLGEK